MTTRTKYIFTYVIGIVTGFILAFVIAVIVTKASSRTSSLGNLVLFEKPMQELRANSFEVMQVLPDGSALATVKDSGGSGNYGLVVLFLSDGGSYYYDEQIIDVPLDKKVMQVGTFQYETRMDVVKTVPVVDFLDR